MRQWRVTRLEGAVLAACAALVVLHQATRWGWTIDDAAICYAYARNIALGEGVVPWPGGERIEAISDPTWVALLAVAYRLGLDGFAVAKPLGMAFGVATVGLTWRLARRATDGLGYDPRAALLAPVALAVSAQFAIWSASGLENGLWCLLLAGALLRTTVEIDAWTGGAQGAAGAGAGARDPEGAPDPSAIGGGRHDGSADPRDDNDPDRSSAEVSATEVSATEEGTATPAGGPSAAGTRGPTLSPAALGVNGSSAIRRGNPPSQDLALAPGRASTPPNPSPTPPLPGSGRGPTISTPPDAPPRPAPRPWAAVWWLLLCWTRPEGLLYAAVAGAVFAAHVRRARPVLAFAATLAVPLALSEALRLAYFAWPLPNTFYAKIASRGVAPLQWDARGWSQLRDWADRLWVGYYAPVYVLGLVAAAPGRATPADRRRTALALGAVAALALTLLWPGTEDLRASRAWPDLPELPGPLRLARTLAFVAVGLALPTLPRGPGAALRQLCGGTVAAGLAFALLADGDWMGAYRFMSLFAPSLAVLFALGTAHLATRADPPHAPNPAPNPTPAPGPAGALVVAFAVGLLVPPNLSQTRDHTNWNKNETTASVKQRVDHTEDVRRRTFWDEPVTNLDVDQGAHLWGVPDRVEIDMAMLVDIPMARHWYQQRAFIEEYVYTEHTPTFAHVGGWWAKHSGLRRYEGFEGNYFELPGYVDLRFGERFPSVFARRALVLDPIPAQPPAPDPDRVGFDWDIALEDVRQPAPWTPGGPGYLELPFTIGAPREPGTDVQVLGFLARDGRVVASFDLPMGYGLLPMSDWRPGETFRGRHAVPVPADLAPGRYDLGLLVRGPRGYVVPAEQIPAGAVTAPPAFGRGEVRFPGRIEVVDAPTLAARAEAARADLHAAATAGDCPAAEAAWIRLKRHHPTDEAWQRAARPPIARAIADCWAERARTEPDAVAVEHLARAHRWDHHSPVLREVAAPRAARWVAEGRRARAEQDWETAYRRFADALRVEPWRAWARRWAEEARDHRLGLVNDVRIGIGGEDDLRAVEEGRPPTAEGRW